MKAYLALLRPHQWVKNTFIFLPLFFGSRLWDTRVLINTTVAFAAFCVTASAVYIFNDYMDMEDDRKHPQNRSRPLASGAVDKTNALMLMSALAAALFHSCASISR